MPRASRSWTSTSPASKRWAPRVQEAGEIVRQAREAAETISSLGAQLEEQRQAIQQLAAEAREARAGIDALAGERQELRDAREELRVEAAIRQLRTRERPAARTDAALAG